jgi:hypothetical protein
MQNDDHAKMRESSMALKFKFKSKAEVPAEHAALYSERAGACRAAWHGLFHRGVEEPDLRAQIAEEFANL